MVVLSKSKLLAYRQCPKRLWLELHQPELKADSAATLASFASGHQVGDLARQLYDPEGAGTTLDIRALGVRGLLAATRELLPQRRPIFEAGFESGEPARRALAVADVLQPDGETGWRMVEVKSSTAVKDYYLDDAAIQYRVATQAGVALTALHLAHIDSGWTYPGGGDYRGLLVEADVTQEALNRQGEVERWLTDAHEIAASSEPPAVSMGKRCGEPFACGFEGRCRSEDEALRGVVEHPIRWLPGKKSKAFEAHVATGNVRSMREVPDEFLNRSQLQVKRQTLAGGIFFDAPSAARAMARHALPALFLDFETISFAVPVWPGTRPYQQVPFQFSLHRIGADGATAHSGFLDLTGADPSERIARALAECRGSDEPVFAYSKSFEGARLKDLARRFPALEQPLLSIESRLVDLLPVAVRFYYHPDQHGSWSIKKVLPTIAPELRYEALEEVQDGGGAVQAYLEAIDPGTSQQRRQLLYERLWRYCRLDTFAMIRLWAHFAGRNAFVDPVDACVSCDISAVAK